MGLSIDADVFSQSPHVVLHTTRIDNLRTDMDIGKIIGTIVATRKDPSLVGTRLLVVQPLDADGESVGSPLVAVDPQGAAGYGDEIYMVTGGDAVVVSANRRMPVDVAVVGIVDSITTTSEAEE